MCLVKESKMVMVFIEIEIQKEDQVWGGKMINVILDILFFF